MAKMVIVRRNGWWAARTLRERRLVLAMLALLLLVLLWLLLVRPVMDARAAVEERLNAAVTDLARARSEAALRQPAAGPAGEPVPLPLDGFLMQQAGEQGLTNLQVTAQGPARARIAIGNVRPQALFGWIAQLEARGVVVESLGARANADQTISVEAVLRARNG